MPDACYCFSSDDIEQEWGTFAQFNAQLLFLLLYRFQVSCLRAVLWLDTVGIFNAGKIWFFSQLAYALLLWVLYGVGTCVECLWHECYRLLLSCACCVILKFLTEQSHVFFIQRFVQPSYSQITVHRIAHTIQESMSDLTFTWVWLGSHWNLIKINSSAGISGMSMVLC